MRPESPQKTVVEPVFQGMQAHDGEDGKEEQKAAVIDNAEPSEPLDQPLVTVVEQDEFQVQIANPDANQPGVRMAEQELGWSNMPILSNRLPGASTALVAPLADKQAYGELQAKLEKKRQQIADLKRTCLRKDRNIDELTDQVVELKAQKQSEKEQFLELLKRD